MFRCQSLAILLRRRTGYRTVWLFLCIAILVGIVAPRMSGAQSCTVSAVSQTVLSRRIQIDLDCPNAPFFKLSESSDYQETINSGIVISLESVSPLGDSVEVSVQYPGEITGGNEMPPAVADAVHEVRILAVLFSFSDGELAHPSYATPTWVQRLVFGSNHDGLGLANSLKAHIEQNTYGTVDVSGDVYPSWVDVSSIETYRDLNLSPTPDRKFAEDIVQRLVETNPDFFDGKTYDFLIALTPGGLEATTLQPYSLYSQWTDKHGIFKGWAIYDIPIEPDSQLYDTIHDEPRVSTTDTIVVPKYNPKSVDGVWLASDVEHTGTNYFTGGRVRYDTSNSNLFAHFIELGTALPDTHTDVIVSYTPRAYRYLSDVQNTDIMPDTFWFGLMSHEFYHAADWLLNEKGKSILDLYQSPMELISNYDVMAEGNWNRYDVLNQSYYVPGHLSAYSKVNLGILQPYELTYGESESHLLLYRMEEGDLNGTESRIKVIKVPLHDVEDVGYMQLVDGSNVERHYAGKEYLLLEWRYKGDLNAGAFNFDAGLPHAGLVIYHVIESDPTSHGNNLMNLVQIVDATPAAFPFASLSAYRAETLFSLETSAAPFGDASGQDSYIAAASWNWKAGDATTAEVLLSPGSGSKTIYAKFMDLNGQIIDQPSLTVTLDDSQQPPTHLPSVTITGYNDNDIVSGNVYIEATPEAPLQVQQVAFYVDGNAPQRVDRIPPYGYSMNTTAFSNGTHTITAEVIDLEGNLGYDTVALEVQNNDTLPPSVLLTYPDDGDTVSGSLFVTASAADSQGIERVDFYIDGVLTGSHTSNNPYFISWDTSLLNDGMHLVQARAYDRNGNSAEASISVTVANGTGPVNTPPVASAGSDQTVTDDDRDGVEGVSFDATGSFDPDGSITAYTWYEGSTAIASGATPTVSLGVGAHTVTLVVTDNQNATASRDVLATVLPGDIPPLADAGVDRTVSDVDGNCYEGVSLDGSGSSDPDGSITAYTWYEGSTAIASGATPTVSLGVGVHTLALTVTDDRGDSDSDELLVNVTEAGLNAPGALTAQVAGDTVTLSWVDQADNEDGFYVEYGEKVKRDILYTQLPTGPDVTSYNLTLPAGTYYFRVRAFRTNCDELLEVSDYAVLASSVSVGSTTKGKGKSR